MTTAPLRNCQVNTILAQIGKSWKMAFAAYMLSKEKEPGFILAYMAAGYIEGNKADKASRPYVESKAIFNGLKAVFTSEMILGIFTAIAVVYGLYLLTWLTGPMLILSMIMIGMNFIGLLFSGDYTSSDAPATNGILNNGTFLS